MTGGQVAAFLVYTVVATWAGGMIGIHKGRMWLGLWLGLLLGWLGVVIIACTRKTRAKLVAEEAERQEIAREAGGRSAT
jgi:hypothetical protein